MLALIQRVTQAQVQVEQKTIGAIEKGILALIGISKSDGQSQADRLLERILNYRIFDDEAGKMNLSLKDIQGGLLLVPQFTLAADTQKGTRPGFSTAMPPEQSEQLFNYFVAQAQAAHQPLATGQFRANMQVSLCNDGPVTFLLETK
jgi:D-tyrosyl-tRNA(Tyr) deacylase